MTASERMVVISSDGHCGGRVLDYRPYLESAYLEEFDRWAATYKDAWEDLEDSRSDNDKMGLASFEASFNWESQNRLEHIESQGVSAEVLFPNTAPPFSPHAWISSPAPRSRQEWEHRFAGVRAHNRWLVDFCADAPGRRAGLAQIFLDDIEAAVAEVRWAKAAGLMGVLLPSDHTLKMENLYYPKYDPLWAACEELGLPVVRHATLGSEKPEEAGPASTWVGVFEGPFFYNRGIFHLLCGGVFERFPGLKYVTTETSFSAKIVPMLDEVDTMYNTSLGDSPIGVFTDILIGDGVAQLKMAPSEYYNRNCYLANPFDFRTAYNAGLPNLLWGADLPHSEGSTPFTREALRLVFEGIPEDEVRHMTSGNAIELFGFDPAVLQRVADRVGPTYEEIATPLRPEERPQYPQDTRCTTFSIAGSVP
jgi:predicted TIM-barrel fold metal-dependent hydrolase